MNYKQIAKKLNIKNQNIKTIICDLLEELKASSYIKEIRRGYFRLNLKNLCLAGVLKTPLKKESMFLLEIQNILFQSTSLCFL